MRALNHALEKVKSICTSIFRQTSALQIFIHSIIVDASVNIHFVHSSINHKIFAVEKSRDELKNVVCIFYCIMHDPKAICKYSSDAKHIRVIFQRDSEPEANGVDFCCYALPTKLAQRRNSCKQKYF